MAYIIPVVNQKGGAGKSMVSFNLAGAYAADGKKVLFVDMDEQGTMTARFFGGNNSVSPGVYDIIDPEDRVDAHEAVHSTPVENISILPANKKLRRIERLFGSDPDSRLFLSIGLQPVMNEFDFIVIDCPGNLGLLSEMALAASSGAIIPVECASEAINPLSETLRLIEHIRKSPNPELSLLGIVLNRFNARRSEDNEYRKLIRNEFGQLIFDSEFRDHSEYKTSTSLGVPIVNLYPKSEHADSYRAFSSEVKARLGIISLELKNEYE